jgi:4-hydroxy-3-polyprenylbenzoate decarboxylase
MATEKRIVVGMSGSSGAIYGVRLVQALKKCSDAQLHLIVSAGAEANIRIETGLEPEGVKALADVVHDPKNLAASLASGSFKTMGMVVAPCSMKTLSEIAYSDSNNLLVRAADVCLKERRKLVLVPRETPLHRGHLELMLRVTESGGVILPPVPAFYHQPKTIEDLISHTVGKILDQFDIEHDLFRRWTGIPSN